ncbi:Rsp5p-dependent ubiquitination, sorting of cargo proteins at the multivesicular body [Allomyces arbusculus]|nr:Rsp5p-dependent ubiquitination, sorting of cargo proteins at the multivesicular body [Allomyces arbusculus]
MASPSGDTPTAARLIARGVDSWDADTFGSPSKPLIGPAGVPGYWDRASIAASDNAPPGAIRNCTFVTYSSTTRNTTMYFGASCPFSPHKPFGDSPWVEAVVGVALSLAGCALVIGCFVVKSKLEREPDVTMQEWARRAWAAVAKWVRMRASKEGRVELALSARGDKYMRAHPQNEVEWTPALIASLMDVSVLTEMDIPPENLDKVQVARGEIETRIEFFPQRRVVPSPKCHERARNGDVVVFTKLPIPWVPPSVVAPDILRHFLYFELSITALAPSTTVAVGLARRPFPPFRLPGRNAGSIGYHSSSGLVHNRQSEPAFFYWLPRTSHALQYGLGDVVGVGVSGGKVYFAHNGELALVQEMMAEPGMHVAIGATGPCTVSLHWHGPWRWSEANEKGYNYVHENGSQLLASEQEPASLGPLKDGEDAPPPYSREAESSSFSRRP